MKKTAWEKVEVEKLEVEKLSNKISRQMISGEHTTVAWMSLVRGAVVQRHSHPNDQYTLMLSGAYKLIFDDGEVMLRTGEMVFITPNIPHVVEALEDSVSLDIFGPRREDWISKNDAYLRD